MIVYLIKSILLLGVLFLIYKLILENEKMHRFNRAFLIFALIFGLTGPLITFDLGNLYSSQGQIPIPTVEPLVKAPAEFIEGSIDRITAPPVNTVDTSTLPAVSDSETQIEAATTPPEASAPFPINTVLWSIYGIVTALLVIRLFGGILNLIRKPKGKEIVLFRRSRLVLLDEQIVPHSFLRYVFLNKEDYNSGKITPEILDHELAHVQQRHSWDVLFLEFLKALFWFNPLLYVFKRSIQLNHEFLADEFALRSGTDVQEYQRLLLSAAGKTQEKTITSSLNFGLTKRRLLMMNKRSSRLRTTIARILLFPLIGLTTFVFCSEAEPESYYVVINPPNETIYFDKEVGIYPAIPSTGNALEYYDEDRTLITDTVSAFRKKDDLLLYQLFYEDGLQVGSITYDSTGAQTQRYEHLFADRSHAGFRSYDKHDTLIQESIGSSLVMGSGLGTMKEWYPNGQLKFEMATDSNRQYQGMMTLYAENGEVLQQELYKDGELIEKIK